MEETPEPAFDFYIIIWVIIATLLLVVCFAVFNKAAVCGAPDVSTADIVQPLETVEQHEANREARRTAAINNMLMLIPAVPYYQTAVFKKAIEEAAAKKPQKPERRFSFFAAKADKASVAEEVCSICLVEFELETTSTEMCKELGCKVWRFTITNIQMQNYVAV